jgi:two-component system, chemotaxis family, chemotaxis protein CheY
MLRRQTHPILVIEDNADLRESISEILALNGFLASGVENGKAALDMLEESQTPPALILLDLTMPVMDGVTFLEHFKQTPRFRKIPVLLMTAQEAPPASDVAALLPKPFTPRSLLSLVKQFLTRRAECGVAVPATRI